MSAHTSRHITTIAVDALGGDFAPDVVLAGVSAALAADPDLRVLLCGPDKVVTPFVVGATATFSPDRLEAVVTTEAIAMDEHPAQAVRSKKDSSLVVCARLVKEGQAQAFFSAGSTGACLAATTLVVGRIRGVKRPALAVVLPGERPCIMTDNGANADCKPEYLLQFAEMGRAYAQAVLGVEEPSVALLNIGEEDSKGSSFALEAHGLMREHTAGFIGNVEGRDLLAGTADVVVTDGFTGNVALKALEGAMSFLLGKVKGAFMTNTMTKLASVPLSGAVKSLKNDLDPDQYGAAPLLGVQGLCLVGHGSASAQAITSGILVGAKAVRNKVTERITEALGQ